MIARTREMSVVEGGGDKESARARGGGGAPSLLLTANHRHDGKCTGNGNRCAMNCLCEGEIEFLLFQQRIERRHQLLPVLLAALRSLLLALSPRRVPSSGTRTRRTRTGLGAEVPFSLLEVLRLLLGRSTRSSTTTTTPGGLLFLPTRGRLSRSRRRELVGAHQV